MDPKILSLFQSLQEGALTAEEAATALGLVVSLLDEIRPKLKKFWLRIMLDGVKVSLLELQEHLEELIDA